MDDPRQSALQVEIWFTLYRLRCIQEPAQYAAADARLGRLRTYQELIK